MSLRKSNIMLLFLLSYSLHNPFHPHTLGASLPLPCPLRRGHGGWRIRANLLFHNNLNSVPLDFGVGLNYPPFVVFLNDFTTFVKSHDDPTKGCFGHTGTLEPIRPCQRAGSGQHVEHLRCFLCKAGCRRLDDHARQVLIGIVPETPGDLHHAVCSSERLGLPNVLHLLIREQETLRVGSVIDPIDRIAGPGERRMSAFVRLISAGVVQNQDTRIELVLQPIRALNELAHVLGGVLVADKTPSEGIDYHECGPLMGHGLIVRVSRFEVRCPRREPPDGVANPINEQIHVVRCRRDDDGFDNEQEVHVSWQDRVRLDPGAGTLHHAPTALPRDINDKAGHWILMIVPRQPCREGGTQIERQERFVAASASIEQGHRLLAQYPAYLPRGWRTAQKGLEGIEVETIRVLNHSRSSTSSGGLL